MLHEDDSTDDEGKVTHKRPPAPTWSRSHVRGEAIAMQSHCPTDVIDSFFSVAPTTPDLKLIFPNIDPSQLKRNSSVLWSTPPCYSELPKY
ncbi:inner centromere protein-like [Drosophila miranda]|uniref:inner centromere protein-like n=1 Tax=Drosophila miranda TaxID=7229 RepID=UPI00143F39B2|nr:inner centromere protein-like [Drosophila miranda]